MAHSWRPATRSAPIANGLHDRDVDPVANPRATASRVRSVLPIESHQRLIVNPFLAVFGLLLWTALFQLTVNLRRLELFVPVVGSGVFLIFLLEYHCLDCGRTGRLLRSKSHVCERVEVRSLSGGNRWSFWPSAIFQTVLWGFGISLVAVFLVLTWW